MVDEATLNRWFAAEVLPLERALTSFISRNWRSSADVTTVAAEALDSRSAPRDAVTTTASSNGAG